MFWRKKPLVTMGLSAHGMVMWPVSPCRAALFQGHLILSRRGGDPLIADLMVQAAARSAKNEPQKLDTEGRSFSLGTDGPSIRLTRGAGNLDDLVAKTTLEPLFDEDCPRDLMETWFVIAAGFAFRLPKGAVVHAPAEPGRFPEIHLQGVRDAFVGLQTSERDVEDLEIRDPVRKVLLPSAIQRFNDGALGARCWEYSYEHGGEEWRQRFYATRHESDDDAVTALTRAQAPTREWARMEAIAETVVASLGVGE